MHPYNKVLISKLIFEDSKNTREHKTAEVFSSKVSIILFDRVSTGSTGIITISIGRFDF